MCSRDVIYSLVLNAGYQPCAGTRDAAAHGICSCGPLRKTHNNVPFTGQMMSNCDEELGQEG